MRTLHGEVGTIPGLVSRSLRDFGLMRLNLGVFVLHFILMAVFVSVPTVLEQQLGLHRESHWQVYLPTLALSILGMVPLMILAERKGRLRAAFILAILVILLAQGPLGGMGGAFSVYVALWLFFVGFNYLEASLPSLVSKTVYAGGKGTALGVYSTFQFLGAFAGGAIGGAMFQAFGSVGVALASAAIALLWLLASFAMTAPRDLENLVVRLPEDGLQSAEWIERLQQAAGVADLLVLDDENTVYLKVDGEEFDHGVLPEAGN